MVKLLKIVGITVGIVFLLVVIVTLGTDLYFVKIDKQFVLRFANGTTLTLGTKLIPESKKATEAFSVLREDGNILVREPKYIYDGKLISEENGVVVVEGKNNEKFEYLWQTDTGYSCVADETLNNEIPWPEKIDDLSKFRYFFSGNSRTKSASEIDLNNFRKDKQSGNFVKLYLLDNTADVDGRFSLLGIVQFTTNQYCGGGGQ